jgi:aliphatic aldoxime dehydratase
MNKQLDESPELVALSQSPRLMPPDWRPPAPAWSASFAQQSTPVVMAYFGIQINTSASPPVDRPIDTFFEGTSAPPNAEAATYVDRAGYQRLLSCAYWTDSARYETWQENSGFAAWWNDPARLHDGHGYFREILIVSADRFETIFSRNCQVGVANTGRRPIVRPIRRTQLLG